MKTEEEKLNEIHWIVWGNEPNGPETTAHRILEWHNQQQQQSPAPVEDGWINVKDRLPQEDERVLIHFNREYKGSDPSICIGQFEKNGDTIWWYCWEAHEDELVNVTHWQPLPTTPNHNLAREVKD